ALWPEPDDPGSEDGAQAGAASRDGAAASGDSRGTRSPGAMTMTPQLAAAIDALPPADEDPRMDGRDLRAPDPGFRLRRMLAPVAPLLAVVAVLVALDPGVGLSFPIIVRYAIDHGVSAHRPGVLFATAATAAAVVAANW